MDIKRQNPLAKHFRQPILYISLPSQGKWYPADALDVPVNGQLPIYAMTAKDEITMKTPDALLNGASTAHVIESCCPGIKDPWKMPTVDLDTILIAIRLATYGEMMTTPIKIQDLELEYQVDLRTIMDQLASQINWNPVVPINDKLTVFVKGL